MLFVYYFSKINRYKYLCILCINYRLLNKVKELFYKLKFFEFREKDINIIKIVVGYGDLDFGWGYIIFILII